MKRLKKYGVALVIMIVICSILACDKEYEEWPQTGLAVMLPEPADLPVSDIYEYSGSFSCTLNETAKKDFNNYVEKCKEKGFVVDADSDTNGYEAYNEDGYTLRISFYESSEQIHISLGEPKIKGTITWPTQGLATLIETPTSTEGTINIDSSIQFSAWIGKTTFEEYKEYVKKCVERGFDVDYNNSENVYKAHNQEGISLHVEYEGFNTMYISLYMPDDLKDDTQKSEETTKTNEGTTVKEETSTRQEETSSKDNVSASGISPEFKAAMDNYESFMNEYCDFIKKYSENPADIGLIADYAAYMSKYAEAMEKMNEINSEELSAEELVYYLAVTERVAKKLASIEP